MPRCLSQPFHRRAIAAAWVWACWAAPGWGAPMAAPVKTEVQTLLSRLEASGCEFNRNGSWHSPAEARSHLQMKLDYIVERAELHSAEEFIDMAATQSSWSGRPYLVRCSKAEPMPSATWMRQQLLRLREDSRPQNGANAAR